MKSKRGLVLLLILTTLFTTILAFAQNEADIDKSYSCLKEQLGGNCGDTKSIEQITFNLIAMSYDSSIQSDCKSSLNNKKNNNCWGDTESSPCNIKPTALAALALNHIGRDVNDEVDWLLEKRKSDTGLTWFLEIDANNITECDINGKKITMQENKKITGSDPAGLKKAYNNYWFEITNTKENYTVSCDEDFITTLLYKKPGSEIYHVSSKTQSAPAHDSLTEKVESYCFSASSECDYEGSLWATFALAKIGEDISFYLPYLSAMSDEASNKKYLPSAFLYILTDVDDYYSELISLQKQNKYWDESKKKLYDTALALLALQNINADEVEGAKQYLLSIRDSSGCWSTNTAFILYAGWPKIPSLGDDVPSRADCESFGHYCVSFGECLSENTLNNFYCPALSEECCEIQPEEQTCEEKKGSVCSLDQECTGGEVIASDTNYCCLGSCKEISEENECEQAGFFCRDFCSDAQEEKKDYSNSCDIDQICCGDRPVKKSNWWLIVLLIILIILVLLAIIFRNQLRVWLFRIKSGFKSGKPPGTFVRPVGGPPIPPPFPGGMMPRIIPRQPFPHRRAPLGSRASSAARGREKKDTVFEETMKKLREMSQ